MPCYRPIPCVSGGLKPNGKQIIRFAGKGQVNDRLSFKIPCGRCIGCSLDRARQWSIRCVHEAKMHQDSCFITLTYAPEHLPKDGSVSPKPFQKFIKRLRKKTGKKIRYFHCGEYGSKLGRPHYHALIFGYLFPDRIVYREKPFRWYTSSELQELWPFGFSTVADVTSHSASYVARYTLKKVYGESAQKHYGGKHPEYITMSRRPGIGDAWYRQFKSDIYPEGVYVNNGVKTSPPKFYDNLYKKENPSGFSDIQRQRKIRAEGKTVTDHLCGKHFKVSNTDSFRLPVREQVKLSQIRQLKRSLEDS